MIVDQLSHLPPLYFSSVLRNTDDKKMKIMRYKSGSHILRDDNNYYYEQMQQLNFADKYIVIVIHL